MEKVVNLGNLGDIVKVKDGYARNFLIPNKRARRATKEAIAEFEVRRADLEKVAAEKLAEGSGPGRKSCRVRRSRSVRRRVSMAVCSVRSRTRTSPDALVKQGFTVEKAQVRLPEGPLKMVGDHAVQVSLHTDVLVDVTVSVLGEHA